MAIVYKHKRLDTGDIFYIGIGKAINRAYSTKGRNPHWNAIVDKTAYSIEIVANDIEWDEACELEKQLIKQYGRMDLNEGTLCNMSDGGEGTLNAIQTPEKIAKCRIAGAKAKKETYKDTTEFRNKMRDIAIKQWETYKPTEEAKKKMSEAAKLQRATTTATNQPHTTPHTEEAKKKMSEKRKEYWLKKKSGLI